MFFLAEEAAQAAASTSTFDPFDIVMVLFTIIVLIGLVRVLKARNKNYFAIGFALVAAAVFLFSDYVMVFEGWLG
ncbi:hypothetical protein FHS18_006337 [Paenibacillus phyllosphaerae]|uniref:DUF2759 domain-containing protein n=1 Tax=Paenibacillus phyllosphaerae TaxID=274593 RepID=A0A7W5B4I2_9BACL|nr:DUF2759 family protein [Paenibacillus phyllosphaerae]MBB3114218.1 hypothetical protein [Paenibacillus phyllosphaerae]